MRTLTYIGHSAFYIEKDFDGILIDPFITGNPKANFDYSKKKISHIIVTHAHSDHLGDAIEISIKTGAPIIAVFELANYCIQKGAKAIGVNIGGKVDFSWGSVKFLPAIHSSSNAELPYGGPAASVFLDIDGTTIYHAGDTALMSEFSLIGEMYNPYFALLPVGGYYTMDMKEAAIAAKMLFAMEIIPIHYDTFPNIQVNINEFSALIEEQGQKCLPLKPNEFVEL